MLKAVISKGDPTIGVWTGQYCRYDQVNSRLFDMKGLRIPLLSIEFITLDEPLKPPHPNVKPTLHVVTEDCHLVVSRWDRIITMLVSVKVTTSKPAMLLPHMVTGATDSVARQHHQLKRMEVIEVI